MPATLQRKHCISSLVRAGVMSTALALYAAACGKNTTEILPDLETDAGSSAEPPTEQPDGSAGTGPLDASAPDASLPRPPQKLLLLHTNDIHSHLRGYGPERDYTPATVGDDTTHGGMARLATGIGGARARAALTDTPVLLLDAGDFTMGTLFELLATQAVPELALMQALGYDATTLGNHELDWTPTGLAAMLQAAQGQHITLPILSSNMHFSADPGDDALEALGPLPTKLIKTIGGIKVGIFGLLGANAVTVTPQARPLTFDPIAVAAARMVSELRDTDHVDLVIALSHSGIDHEGHGEDADLAAAVPGIDVIVSGHTHDTLSQPAQIGQTLIVTAGSYAAYLGELALTVTPSAAPGGQAKITVDDYTLLGIDDTLPGDTATEAAVEQYITALDQAALVPRGLAYRQVVATTAADVPFPLSGEAPLGDLVTDAYRGVVSALQPTDPPAIAIDANGQLRASIVEGKTGEIWFADLFQVLPLGIGPDQVPGYPLVSYYLNARDIRSGLELGGVPELAGADAFLQVSGIKVEYDRTQLPLQRVSGLTLITQSGEQALDMTDTTHCYQVVSTNYVAGLLGLVSSATGGLLSVEAKDADCTTIVDPTTRFIDADPVTAGVQELKAWQALYGFVSNFPDTNSDGIPDVPSAYAATQGRILGF